MRTNELMIGDWVKTNDIYKAIKNVKVYDISQYSVQDEITNQWIMCHYIEPIPLTAEILEANGFKDIGDEIFQLEEKPFWCWVDFMNHQYGCEFDTSTYECESSEHRLKLYGLPSVHELQHALKLCGIDKKIEL